MHDCIFCKIVAGEIPSNKVYEDDHIYAFEDINPVAPVHVLIIPKVHIVSMLDVSDEQWGLIGEIHRVAQQLAHELKIADNGFRLVNNCGKEGGQTVDHLHFHLISGRQLSWPPG